MHEPLIVRFMTKSPHTIGQHQSLAVAHRLMREHAIRHLPVLEGGKLVGILSQRDLYFIETLKGIDLERVKVSEAMTPEAYAVGLRSSVRKVAAEMAEHKYGCAVVLDKDRVVGVFTTVDALQVLRTLLDQQRTDPDRGRARSRA